MKKLLPPLAPLAYSYKTLSAATDLSETLLREATRAGDLPTYSVIIAGQTRKAKRIRPEDAIAFAEKMLVQESAA